jgi:UvrD/REP helicase N-terminal domain
MSDSRDLSDDIPFPAGPPAGGTGEDDGPDFAPRDDADERADPRDAGRGEDRWAQDAPRDTRSISQRAAATRPQHSHTPADFFAGLNSEQRDAVETTDGPLLVLAGAGTGKTRVLTTRVAHILNQRKAWPSQMLVVTFTNKAAREMRERTMNLIGPDAEGLRWLGTFHSVSAQMPTTSCA